MLTFKRAIIPVITMAFFILMSVLFWQVPIQLALFFEISLTVFLALLWGYKWAEIEEMLFSSFKNIGSVILILLLIGMMIGIWIGIGTVPTMIYYGLKTINPKYFFVLSFISASVVSMAVGTAVGTASTIGLALISVAESLGLSLPLAAGAIISGCYVGDRMSPVSSIANITAHSSGADLIDMIKHMIVTIIPPYIISLLVYYLVGIITLSNTNKVLDVNLIPALKDHFFISAWMLLPPLFIIILAFFRIPTILNLLVNIFFSLVMGIFISQRGWIELLNTMFAGFSEQTGVGFIDKVLARGGLSSMLELISLIIFAVILGGLLEKLGVLSAILNPIINHIKNKFRLVSVTIFSSIASAILGCNQFLAVFLPARMLMVNYDKLGLPRKELARALGDSGLILSPLIPWNVNALMMTAVLGVKTIDYLPYAFLPLLLPITNLIFAFFAREGV